MNAIAELRSLGIDFDASPPLRDARTPFAMGFRERGHAPPELAMVAVAALLLERFWIPEAQGGERSRYGLIWRSFVDALLQLPCQADLLHVLVTRKSPGADGSALRSGWLILGHGKTATAAAAAAERALLDLRAVALAYLDYVTLRPVTEAEALLDLARPLAAPFVQSLQRAPLLLDLGVRSPSAPPNHHDGPTVSLCAPWSTAVLDWAPLAATLAHQGSPAAFVIRMRTAVSAPQSARDQAAAELIAIERAHDNWLDQNRAQSALVTGSYERLRDLAGLRVLSLRGPCLAAVPMLTAWEPLSPGLTAVATAALVAPARGVGKDTHGAAEHMVREHVTRLAPTALCADALWTPLGLEQDHAAILTPAEAPALVRTIEPPQDECSPLPCSRARQLPVRSVSADGGALGDADGPGGSGVVRLSESARFRHVYIVGQTGTGKSTLLLNLVVDDILRGHGVTVLDPHGALLNDVLDRIPKERAEDVILVDPSQTERYVGLNPFVIDAPDTTTYLTLRDRVISDLIDTFDAIYDLSRTGGPIFEQYFRLFSSLLLGANKPTDYTPSLPMLELVIGDAKLRDRLRERLAPFDPVTSAVVQTVLKASGDSSLANTAPYITSKVTRFQSSAAARRMFCQPACLDFENILLKRRILLVQLSAAHIGADAAALVARQVVLRLSVAAMARPPKDAVPHFIYADEFHNFATERFATLLAEARKFKVGLVLAHQYTSQLTRRGNSEVLDAILGNVGTVVAFRVGAKDAKLLEGVMAPRAAERDITGLPNFCALVRSVGELGNVPFTLRTRAAIPAMASVADAIRTLALLAHGRAREFVDDAIKQSISDLTKLSKSP
jgi:hypothetical protein